MTSPISTGGHSTPVVSNANGAGGVASRPMSPTHAAVAAALSDDGLHSHQRTPLASRNDRYGYLEHSGRGLHLGAYYPVMIASISAVVRAGVERCSMTHCDRAAHRRLILAARLV